MWLGLAVISIAATLVLALGSGGACPAHDALGQPLELGEASVSQRLAFVEDRLDAAARAGQTWAGLWGLTYGLAAGVQYTYAGLVHARGRQIDGYVGGTTAALAMLIRAVWLPASIRERRRHRRRRPQDPCARLQQAEAALARSARWERREHSIFQHGLALGFSTVVAIVHGVAFRRPVAANRGFVLGSVAGQVMVLTSPRVADHAVADYRAGRLSFAPLLAPGTAGLSIGGRF